MTPSEERIYSESELLQVLKGLMHVYYSKPWWTRWMFKPWLTALQTVAAVLCGDKVMRDYETAQTLKDVDDILNQ